MSEPFTVLFVCTGNICRSPMAERLFTAGLRRRLGPDADRFRVVSAGTWGYTGSPMEPFAAEALAELGADPDGFVARELEAAHVAQADLVLAATREHRAAAVTLHPRGAGQAFTIREFGRLAAGVDPGTLPADDPVERAHALRRAAAARRGLEPPPASWAADVRDPYGATRDAFRDCAATIADALRVPLNLLADGGAVE